MRKFKYLFTVMLICALTIFYFQNCGSGHNSAQNSSGGQNKISVSIYEQTLYPSVKNHCSRCHGINQNPLFGIFDSQISHDVLIDSLLVSLNNPTSSYIIQKIRSGHQGFSSTVADEFQNQIINWSMQLQNSN